MRHPTQTGTVLAMCLLSAVAVSADLDKGLAAYDVGDYATSLAECQPLAEEGMAMAQFCIGRLYANGFGVAMDDALALQWYGRAAEQGHSEAQFNLGVMHSNGWGVEMNDAEAAKWYRLAAEQGYAQAQTNLATAYQKGRGVEQNLVEAYKWFAIATRLGDANARYDRDLVKSELSAEELAAAEGMIAGWLDAYAGEVLPDD